MRNQHLKLTLLETGVIPSSPPPPKKIKVHAEKGSLRGVAESENKKIAEGVFMPERESGG